MNEEEQTRQTDAEQGEQEIQEEAPVQATETADTDRDNQNSQEETESAGQETVVYSNEDNNDLAQVGDGTSGSGAADHGGPISGAEGESDSEGDSSATKLDDEAGGNPSMETEETATAAPSGEADASAESGETAETGAEGGDAQSGETPAASQAPAAENTGASQSDDSDIQPVRSASIGHVAQNASMEDLMRASDHHFRPIKHGDVIEGIVMKVDRDEILIDIGGKTEGIIPSREATSMSAEERESLKVGDELLVAVMQSENNEGHVLLSLDRARQERAWRDLQRIHESGETIEAQIVGHNKGGLLVNIQGIRGFIPSSQVSSLPPGEANKQAEMSRMQNQTIPLKVIEINRNRNRLILSERQAMQEQRESMRTRLLQELEAGQIRPGTVTSVCDFGAFVDIGGADGLIHLSELSWKRVSHPREVLNVGDRVDVYVLSVDSNERKIALSLKRTQPEPWDTIAQQYQIGQSVRGTITQITTFGAFARLEDGIEGLIHVSELAEGRVQHPRNVVKEGEVHDLKVIRIDPARKRIGLSLKRAQEEANREAGGGEEAQQPAEGESAGTETSVESPEPAARTQQFQQQVASSQQKQAQQPRERDRDRDRDRGPKTATTAPIDMAAEEVDDLPMGSMAHAFAALQRQRGSILSAGEESESASEGGEDAAAEQSEPTVIPEPIGTISGTTTEADLDAVSEMGGIEFDAGTEGDATDMVPEADANAGSEATGGEVQGAGPTIGEEAAEEPSSTDAATDSGDMPTEEESSEDGTDAEEETATEMEAETATETPDAESDTGAMPSEEEATEGATETEAEPAAEIADAESDAGAADEDTPTETANADAASEDISASSNTESMTDVATDSGDMPAEEETAADSGNEAETQSSMPAASEAADAEGEIAKMMDTYPMESPDANTGDMAEGDGADAEAAADNTAAGDEPEAEADATANDDLDKAGMSGAEGAPSEGDGETKA